MKRNLFTTDTDVRIRWFGSVMAFIVLCGYYAIIMMGMLGYGDLSAIGQAEFFVLALVVLAAGTWAFGIDLIDAYLGGE